MKNRIFFFALAVSLFLASANLFATEDKAGWQVVIEKHGQATAVLELPKQYFKSNTQFYTTAQVSVLNSKTGQLVLVMMTDNSNLDLSSLASGNYIVEIDLDGSIFSRSISL